MKTTIKILIVLTIAVLVITIAVWLFVYQKSFQSLNLERQIEEQEVSGALEDVSSKSETENSDITVTAQNLSIPWDVVFLPTGEMLVTERNGYLLVFRNGLEERIRISGVEYTGEGGLLGMALHPDFSVNNYLYLYHTSESENRLINRVVRYEFSESNLSNPEEILGNIPGARFHDGGRIAFGPDGFLYITVGDAGNPGEAQNTSSLAGKILRIHDDGQIPADNPFGNAVWSYGHRNPQGLAWDDEGRLWSTEHGRSGISSGFDEVNLIEKAANYGWPESQGNTVLTGTKAPILHSGSQTTWAPASVLYWQGSLFFGGLRGETLYEAVLDGEDIKELREHFKDEFGRIRTVALGLDGMFYLTTSNQDGRGRPVPEDDRVIKINPKIFR